MFLHSIDIIVFGHLLARTLQGRARVSVWGGTGRAPKARDDRGAEGAEGGWVWGGGVPLPTGGGIWGGGCAPSPEKFLIFFFIKMVSSGALWVAISYRLAACFI